MVHRKSVEAEDRSLKDIRNETGPWTVLYSCFLEIFAKLCLLLQETHVQMQ